MRKDRKSIFLKKVNFRLRLIVILPLLFVLLISGYGIIFLYNISDILYTPEALNNLRTYLFINVLISFCIGLAITYALLLPLKRLGRMVEDINKNKYKPRRHMNFEEEIEEVFASFEQLHSSIEKRKSREIVHRLTSLGQLAAGVAHEIRNPLGSIKGLASLIDEDLPQGHPKKEYVNVIIKEAEKLEVIINRFLNLTSAGYDANLNPVEINLNLLLDELISLAQFNPSSQGIDIVKKYNADVKIFGDKERLSHVFLNVILNAYQAMPEGGVLTISLNVYGDNIEIRFSDTGAGVSQEDVDKIFDPFFTTKDDGSGLGLTIAHQVVVAHNGKMSFESCKGKGTTFVINLPIGGCIKDERK